MKHPAWFDHLTVSLSTNAEKLTYGGSATALASSGSSVLGLGLSDVVTVVTGIVGVTVALVGLYFQWRRHLEMLEQSKREKEEHKVRMQALLAAAANADGQPTEVTVRGLDRIR